MNRCADDWSVSPQHTIGVGFVFAVIFFWQLSCFSVGAQSAFPHLAAPQSTVQDLLHGGKGRPRADTYYLVALGAARHDNYVDAYRAINQGLALEGRNLKLLNLRAALWAREGRAEDARREFERILRLAPNDGYAQQSLQALNRVLQPRIPPTTPKPPDAAPATPFADKQPTSTVAATANAEDSKLLKAEYFEKIRERQRCYYSMTSLKRAQEQFEQAAPEKKGSFSTKDLIAGKFLPSEPLCAQGGIYSWSNGDISCSVHGRFSEIEVEIKTVFSDFNRGMVAKLSRNYRDAMQAFDQVVILFPKWAEAHFQLGDTLLRLGEDQAAIVRLRECLSISPGNLDGKMLLANAYFKVGQTEAALSLLDEVATMTEGGVYGLAARSLASSIRAGRSYYQIFPPN